MQLDEESEDDDPQILLFPEGYQHRDRSESPDEVARMVGAFSPVTQSLGTAAITSLSVLSPSSSNWDARAIPPELPVVAACPPATSSSIAVEQQDAPLPNDSSTPQTLPAYIQQDGTNTPARDSDVDISGSDSNVVDSSRLSPDSNTNGMAVDENERMNRESLVIDGQTNGMEVDANEHLNRPPLAIDSQTDGMVVDENERMNCQSSVIDGQTNGMEVEANERLNHQSSAIDSQASTVPGHDRIPSEPLSSTERIGGKGGSSAGAAASKRKRSNSSSIDDERHA